MDGGVIGIHRRRETWVDDAPVAHFDVDAFGQPVIDRERGIDEAGQQVAAGGADNCRSNIRGPFGLIGRTGEVEEQAIAFLLDDYVQAHRLIELDAVAIDESFAIADSVGP